MKAGWTSLDEITAPGRPRTEPWVAGGWRFSKPAPEAGSREPEPRWPEPVSDPSAVSPVENLTVFGVPVSFDPISRTHHAEPGVGPGSRRRGGTVVGLVALVLVAGTAGGVVNEVADDDGAGSTVTVLGADPAGLVERPPESIAGVAADVLPSVVSVSAADASGSGFVISEDGYVLTNNHVIASAGDGGEIELAFVDGRRARATLVGASPSYDVAVLQVDTDGLQPVVFGDSSSVAVGDPVVAIGSPLGLDATVTSGIVSALERPVTAGDPSDQSYINALQTDAAINPGNSGGPLVDGAGRVIGVNSAIATLGINAESGGSIGLGFAIPIEQVRRTAEQLITTGEAVYPVMGVQLDNAFLGPGARVAEDGENGPGVTPDGPADEVDIRSGDVIVQIDGEEIRDPAELIVRLRSHRPGDQVDLVVDRGDESLELTVTLDSAVG